jgi:hypothetical protein
MRNELSSLLAQAQVCNDAMNALPCTGFVDSECGCPVPVNNPKSEATAAYVDLVARLNKECSILCPAVLCVRPTRAVCSTLGGEIVGHCVASAINSGNSGPGP